MLRKKSNICQQFSIMSVHVWAPAIPGHAGENAQIRPQTFLRQTKNAETSGECGLIFFLLILISHFRSWNFTGRLQSLGDVSSRNASERVSFHVSVLQLQLREKSSMRRQCDLKSCCCHGSSGITTHRPLCYCQGIWWTKQEKFASHYRASASTHPPEARRPDRKETERKEKQFGGSRRC